MTNQNSTAPSTPIDPNKVAQYLQQLELAILRSSRYQPTYNGRPSCPFCGNFIDDEETHKPTCLVRTVRGGSGTEVFEIVRSLYDAGSKLSVIATKHCPVHHHDWPRVVELSMLFYSETAS